MEGPDPDAPKPSFVGCIVGVVILIVGAALLVPFFVKAANRAKVTGCQGNLSTLWTMENVYAKDHGNRMPEATGKDFWRALTRTNPPLLDESKWEISCCNARAEAKPGEIHYLGPASDVNRLGDYDPVGCDELFNHSSDGKGGGNVLRKAGDVMELNGADWRAVSSRCVP